jgi:protein TonB
MTKIKASHFFILLLLVSVLHAGVLLGVPYILKPVSMPPEEALNITFAAPPLPRGLPPEPAPKPPPAAPAKVVQPTQEEFEKGELEKPANEEPVEEYISTGILGGQSGSSADADFLKMGNIIASQFRLPPMPSPPIEAPKPDPVPPPLPPPERQRIGGEVQEARLIHQVKPVYPPLARRARLERTVQLRVVIGKSGDVRSVDIIEGHSLLNDAAVEAVLQWRFTPMLVDNRPVEFTTEVSVQFHFQ